MFLLSRRSYHNFNQIITLKKCRFVFFIFAKTKRYAYHSSLLVNLGSCVRSRDYIRSATFLVTKVHSQLRQVIAKYKVNRALQDVGRFLMFIFCLLLACSEASPSCSPCPFLPQPHPASCCWTLTWGWVRHWLVSHIRIQRLRPSQDRIWNETQVRRWRKFPPWKECSFMDIRLVTFSKRSINFESILEIKGK